MINFNAARKGGKGDKIMFLTKKLKIYSADLEKSVFEFATKEGAVGITVCAEKNNDELRNYFKKISAKDRCVVIINPVKIRGVIVLYKNCLNFKIIPFGFNKTTGKREFFLERLFDN
jgi:hypothetical protein